jgi:hypothetical protein
MPHEVQSKLTPETSPWPALPYREWRDTCSTLHMWSQIVGKIRLAQAPLINHWWQVPLYITARGLTTSPIPYRTRSFQIDFDFCSHKLLIATSDSQHRSLDLKTRSVAEFYHVVMALLGDLDIEVTIWSTPVEIPDPIPFEQDTLHASYDPDYAARFWQVLVQTERVFTEFRARFLGKVSPIHFFWGSFDLALTRFSGRPAPEHPGSPGLPDWITREAYSHEVISCGFWPGGPGVDEAVYYAYAYPEPKGFASAIVQPPAAEYRADMGELFLPYEAVRQAEAPDETLLSFLQSSYEAAADLGGWDRKGLERQLRSG